VANRITGIPPDDVALVAYIDGELDASRRVALEQRLVGDAELRARLGDLRRGGRPFADAFEVLLAAAPTERLNAMLSGVVGNATTPWRRLSAIAAAIAIFVVGAVTGHFVPSIYGRQPTEVGEQATAPGWRQVVAEYLVLTTGDTLAVIPESPVLVSDELSAVGRKLGLALTPDQVALPHVYLKRAQLFEYRGMPLAQIAYATRDQGPIAFCIIANGKPDEAPAFEQREGSNIVFWTKGGHGYMLIGKLPRKQLEAFASDLDGRVS
jgi:anti-sigma factor RsiW